MYNPIKKSFILILLLILLFFYLLIIRPLSNKKEYSQVINNQVQLDKQKDDLILDEKNLNLDIAKEEESDYNTSKPLKIINDVKDNVLKIVSKIKIPTFGKFVNIEVPFTTQAPFAEWDDPRQQDACEEASLVMVWNWLQNKSLNKKEAKEQILSLNKFATELLGQSVDTSAEDTARIFKEYYNYDQISVVYDIDVNRIKQEISSGNLVVVPTNGKILNNPYYSGSGPERHMIVITGFTDSQFITNDPGTIKGEGFKYDYDIIIKSIINYGSGSHVDLIDERKVILVINKK